MPARFAPAKSSARLILMFCLVGIDQWLIFKFLNRELVCAGGALEFLQRWHADKMIGRARVRSQHGGRGSEQGNGSKCRYRQELHGELSVRFETVEKFAPSWIRSSRAARL